MHVSYAVIAAAIALCAAVPAVAGGAKPIPLPREYTRIVALGDSITDGFSYPLMVRRALGDAGYEKPYMICAGVASDTTAQMLARMDRDVFAHRPTLVTLLGGTNDAVAKVSVDDFAAHVTAIADRCAKAHVKLIILTVPISGPAYVAEREPFTNAYNAWIAQFCAQRGIPVADCHALMIADRAAGRDPIETDGGHPDYLGHQDMTRALLDAMGFPNVALPAVWTPEQMPGLISPWRIRSVPASQTAPLTAADAAALSPDASWKTFTLPITTQIGVWWPDQERERGFVSNFALAFGPAVPGTKYQAVAQVARSRKSTEWMNFGAAVTSAWLNGVQVYKAGAWTGWHAGHDQVQVTLNKGANTVVVECSDPFFVSMTPTADVGPF